MERPEVVDPLKEEEQPPVDKQTDEAFSARGLAEERLGKVGTGILDFVPIAGDVLAAGDVADSYRRGDKLGTAVNLAALGVGVVPIVGDLAAKGLKNALGTYRRTSKIDNEVIDKGMEDIVDSDVVVASTIKAGGKRFVKDQKEIDRLFDKGELNVQEWEAASKKNAINFKSETGIDVTDQYPEIKESAIRYYKEIEEGVPVEQARKRHLDVIERVNPIREWDDVPLPTSEKQQVLSLLPDQRRDGTFFDISKKEAKELGKKLGHEVKTAKLKKDDFIRGRLDVKAYTRFNSWVTTILSSNIKGKGYGDAIHYKSGKPFRESPDGKVRFNVSEDTAKRIVTKQVMRGGKPNPKTGKIEYYDKTPFALVEGYYNPMSAKEIRAKVKKLLKDPEWTQLGFDPRRLTGFYTRNNRDQFPVGSIAKEADEVFQIGPLLLAKNVKLEEVPRLNKGGAIRTYREGGVVPMEEQMNFAFMNEGGVLADDGVERDPVSGNEVPSGSMAEEVRDDIPAMLSEGEYVVPADVVRYHGIQKFEDLRNEAKVGLQRMEADGRIGGQPVEEQDELPFSIEELEVTEAYRGGIMGFQEGGDTGTYEDTFGGPFVANQRYGTVGTGPAQLGFQLRNFTSSITGKTVTIPFYNGKPMQYIPPEFKASDVVGSSGTVGVSDDRDRQEDEAERARASADRGMSDLAFTEAQKAISGVQPQTTRSVKDMSPAELLEIKNARDTIGGKLLSSVPIVGFLMGLQESQVKSAAFEILKNNKNPATGEKLNAADVSALRAITEGPERKGALEILGDWMTGQKFFDPNPRIGYESGQDFRQMYPDILKTEYKPAPKTAPDFVTMSEIGTSDPTPVQTQTQQMFPEELAEQRFGFPDATGTVSEQAKDILADEEAAKTEAARKANKAAGERLDKIIRPFVNLFTNVQGDPDDSAISPSLVGAAMAGDRASYTGPLRVTNVEELGGDDVTKLLVNSFAKQGLDSNSVNYRALLSKVAVESDEYNRLIETSMNYSHENFIKNFGQDKYTLAKGMLRPAGSDGKTNAPDAANTPALFNIAYAGKNGNGSAESGDGFKFRGRGYIQLTGRDNYTNVGNILGVDLTNMSEQDLNNWFSNQQNSADATAAYFSMRQREGQDLSTIEGVNTAVGGTVGGKEKAVEIYNKRHADQQPYTTDIPVTALTQTQTRQRPAEDRPQTLGVPFTATSDQLPSQLGEQASGFAQPQPTQPSLSRFEPIEGATSGQMADLLSSPAYTGDVSQLYGRGFTPEQIGTDPRTGQRGGIPELMDQAGIGEDLVTPSVTPSFGGASIRKKSRQDLKDRGTARRLDELRSTIDATGNIQPPSITDQMSSLDFSPPREVQTFVSNRQEPSRYLSKEKGGFDTRNLSPGAMGGRLRSTLPRVDAPMLDKVELPDMTPFKDKDVSQLYGRGFKPEDIGTDPSVKVDKKPETKTKPKTEKKPAEEQISQQEYEKRVKDATTKENQKARERADDARDSVLQQGGSVQEAFDAAQTAFTGFTPSGEFVGSVDPGTAAMMRFSKGGLASKSKKTKPKKRNVKKGLGGKMAT